MTIRYQARLVTVADLIPRSAEWDRLAEASLDPNPFYQPASLIAAETCLHAGRPIRALIVEDKADGDALCALFPFEKPHLRDGIPFGALSLYRNIYTALTAPLIRQTDANSILAVALKALAEQGARLVLPQIPDDGGAAKTLARAADDLGLAFTRIDGHARAAARTDLSPEAYRKERWSKDTRQNQRRRMARLAELGTVSRETIRGGTPEGDAALHAFLVLEAAGWKGRERTAFAAHPSSAAFARAAYSNGSVIFDLLRLDGRVIAISVNPVSQGAAFSIKSAYDESFARYGVGTLLDGLSIDLVAADGSLQSLDSCAPVTHAVADRWREQVSIGRYMIGLRPKAGLACHVRLLRLTAPYGLWRGYPAPAAE